MKRLTLVLCALMATGLASSACTGSGGECSYDTDCPQLGYVCDTTTNRCVVDSSYERRKEGRCNTDLDCDAVLQRCDQVLGRCYYLYGDNDQDQNENDNADRPPPAGCEPKQPTAGACASDADCATVLAGFVCESASGNCIPDCSAAGTQNQGRDRDGDGWGECCDCLDVSGNPNSVKVNPAASEVIYNNLDDDCNPTTRDADVDGDGHNAVFVGGDDCDDRNASVNPEIAERCDNMDNDCDGQIDELPECQQGNDTVNPEETPTCPDLSGVYNITSYCLQVSDAQNVEFTQTNCTLTFSLDAIYCTGHIDSQMNFYVECGGLGFPCSAKASLTEAFTIVCSPQCSFILERQDQGTPCTFHQDPDCTTTGKLCGVVVDTGALVTECIATIPGNRQPGYYCDDNSGVLCINSLCIDHACGAICEDNVHCGDYEGTSCQTVGYTLSGVTGNIKSCTPDVPGETICRRSPDCSMSRVCSYRQDNDDVFTVCRSPVGGGQQAGAPCTTASDCENSLCVCGDRLCDGSTTGACSEMCVTSSDCVQGTVCGGVSIPDLGGTDHLVYACTRDPDSCGRNADCPAGRSCQVFLDADGLSLITECQYGSGPGYDNTGATCVNPTNCFSVWCGNWGYCLGVCVSDADCPTFETATACATDDTCGLGYLCGTGGTCERLFTCYTQVFYLGDDNSGQPVYDTTNLCKPDRRTCSVNGDCRTGEACIMDYNRTATAALYTCDTGGPGTGQLGADCTGGAEVCWTGLCLIEGGGGPGMEFCSQACATDADCEPTATYSCQAIRVDVRPGFVSYIPACARRN
jgi:hypothetical protein